VVGLLKVDVMWCDMGWRFWATEKLDGFVLAWRVAAYSWLLLSLVGYGGASLGLTFPLRLLNEC
jgi:hypothetical protein